MICKITFGFNSFLKNAFDSQNSSTEQNSTIQDRTLLERDNTFYVGK